MTKIEWCDETWNVLTGCTRVSPGCENCYAERLAATRMKNHPRYHGVAKMTPAGPRFTGEVREHHQLLDVPRRWRKPRMIFVSAQSDLFHPDVPAEFIAKVFATMAEARRHRFQVLTKRPERAADLLNDPPGGTTWPLPNVWIGTSVEDQQRADERIPHLLNCPAAVRFLSVEPLLGPIDLRLEDCWIPDDCYELRERLHWVIIGGESGPGARPMDIAWARSLVEQCRTAGVACFVKQLGARPTGCHDRVETRRARSTTYRFKPVRLRDRKGGDPSEWPEDLRVREFPNEGV